MWRNVSNWHIKSKDDDERVAHRLADYEDENKVLRCERNELCNRLQSLENLEDIAHQINLLKIEAHRVRNLNHSYYDELLKVVKLIEEFEIYPNQKISLKKLAMESITGLQEKLSAQNVTSKTLCLQTNGLKQRLDGYININENKDDSKLNQEFFLHFQIEEILKRLNKFQFRYDLLMMKYETSQCRINELESQSLQYEFNKQSLKAAEEYKAEIEKLKSNSLILSTERNYWKNKAKSLVDEIHRLNKLELQGEVVKLREENIQITTKLKRAMALLLKERHTKSSHQQQGLLSTPCDCIFTNIGYNIIFQSIKETLNKYYSNKNSVLPKDAKLNVTSSVSENSMTTAITSSNHQKATSNNNRRKSKIYLISKYSRKMFT